MKRRNKQDHEISYWESMADGVVGLLLCILLIMMLLILYLIHINGKDNAEDEGAYEEAGYGYSYDHEYADPDGGGWKGEGEEEDDDEGGGGGGFPFEDPDPGMGEGEGGEKAAVWVEVIDGETQRTIKKQGIQFELYNSASTLQILSTYYPTKIDYKKYETDKDGVFYLPEKIPLSTYYLHQLTAVEGYDPADNWEFGPDRDYDWDDPYVVSVSLFPSKNIIRLQLSDLESGEPLSDASFDVIAAENIVTNDGTTRYKQGDVADTLTVNEEGYVESKELYLGKYLIRQKTAPEYYSCLLNDTPVSVKSKQSAPTPALTELKERKTALNLSVTDALYDNKTIAGAEFELTTGNGVKVGSITSDGRGQAQITNLKKGTTYHIRQISSAAKYKYDTEDYVFDVDSQGFINGKEVEDLKVINRITRASFSFRSKIMRGQLSDINLFLEDSNGTVLERWNTSAVDNIIEGLEPGEYRLVVDGNEAKAYTITVNDEVNIQAFIFSIWTLRDICIVVFGVLAGVGVLAGIILLVRRRKQNSKSEG